MTKLIRALSLMTALAVLAGGTVAQDAKSKKDDPKKDTKKDTKKDDKKADDKKDTKKDTKKEKETEAAGSVEVYKGAKGFRYRIKNADGKTVAMPLPQMAWETKEEALKAIDELKDILKTKPVDVKD